MLRSGLNSLVRGMLKHQSCKLLVTSSKYGIFNANKMFNNHLIKSY